MESKSDSKVTRGLSVAGALILAISMTGCAGSMISESSGSISDSFESSSKSSRSSSGDRKEAYQGDIRQYTATYTRSHTDVAGFTRGLSSISEKHGSTNWEADRSTYVGIGQGLIRAGLQPEQIDSFLAGLANGDPVKTAALRLGMEQGR